MVKLDKSRPFGKICGPGESYVYSQDGKKFDGAGNGLGEKPVPKKTETPEPEPISIETRLLIIDKNANGYLSVKEIKTALTDAKVEFNQRNNSRKSLLNTLKKYMGVN